MAGTELNEALDAFRRGDLDRAQALAEAAVAGTTSPQWQHLLGLIHCRKGESAEGAKWLLQASDAEPGNAAFRVAAARALVDSGRAAEVLAMPEPPPIASAEAMALWQVRGEAADAARDHAASERAWRAIAAAAPRDWRAWANLGNALAAQGRWDEAAQALRRAVQLNPSEHLLWRNLAGALVSAERHEEVLQIAGDWTRAGAPPSEAAVLRGRSLAALQRFDEAEHAYESALDLAPGDRHAWHGLGLVYERTGRAERLPALIEAAADAGVESGELGLVPAISAFHEGRVADASGLLDTVPREADPTVWYRLKSRIADRAGSHAEAFDAAAAMNRAMPNFDGWVLRGTEYRARLRAIAAALVRRSEPPQTLDPDGRAPVFLVGFPRSGTTLLDTFLMGHPRISVLEELPLIVEAEKICPVAGIATCPTEALERAQDGYLAGVATHVDRATAGLVVDKMPLNMLAVPLIHALFPDARFIFAQRHPCDAVLSGFMQSFVASEPMASFLTIDGAADFYDAAMTLWTESIAVAPIQYHTIVYEQLVTDPEHTLKPLLAFLGLPWDERLLDHVSSARSRGAIVTPSYDQVTQPLSKSAAGRWKSYRDQLEPVLPLLLPWAERLGYSA